MSGISDKTLGAGLLSSGQRGFSRGRTSSATEPLNSKAAEPLQEPH